MNFIKKLLSFLLSLGIGIGLLSWVINRVGWQEISQSFLAFSWWQALVILGITLIRPMIGIWKWKEGGLRTNGTQFKPLEIKDSIFN